MMRFAEDGCAAERSARHSRTLKGTVGLLTALIAVTAIVHSARASDFNGYAETGWNYDNKAYCCEDAIAAAQEDSAASCEAAGGYPDFRRSSARGRCDWQATRGGDGRRVYKCSANATVRCR